MKSVVGQKYWDTSYKELQLSNESHSDEITNLLDEYISEPKSNTVVELGCFPGKYLFYVGMKGAVVSGIDKTPRVLELIDLFKSSKIKIGKLLKGNIFNHHFGNKFDVVMSFGLIEHFLNWEEILDIHDSLVKKGGKIIVTCPNFRSPINFMFRKIFDSTNLKRHVIGSMNEYEWAKYLELKNYKIDYAGSIGNPHYWFDSISSSDAFNNLRNSFTMWLNNESHKFPFLKNVKTINVIVATKI
jgi:SAM-dependent methyltransferase